MHKFNLLITALALSTSSFAQITQEFFDDSSAVKKVKMEGMMVDGKKQGLWKVYDKAGVVTAEVNYATGVEEGLSKNFFLNGAKALEASFKNGKENGAWKEY